MALPLGSALDAVARAIVGLPDDLQKAINEVIYLNRALQAKAERLEQQHQADEAEIARLNDALVTRDDALRSVRRAVAAWEQLLGS